MKAEELRIGNMVYDENFMPCNIISISETSIRIKYPSELFEIGLDDSIINPIYIHPIPLNKDTLICYGLKKIEEGKWSKGNVFIIYWNERMGFYHGAMLAGKSIQSVHELQNLYFALTNEELEMLS